VSDGSTHAAGMSPLQALILDRMRSRGWTPKDVEDRGVAHATLHRYMNPVELKQPPRSSVLQSLASALDLPLARVQRAAVESVGYEYHEAESPEPTNPADVEAAIRNDPGLLPEARDHLLSQYRLLLRIRGEVDPDRVSLPALRVLEEASSALDEAAPPPEPEGAPEPARRRGRGRR
jgi:hypothetical protein